MARDLAWWARQVNEMSRLHWRGSDSTFDRIEYPCCDYERPRARWQLEEALNALPRRARRELAAVVAALDARVLAATYGGEPEAPGWWLQRF